MNTIKEKYVEKFPSQPRKQTQIQQNAFFLIMSSFCNLFVTWIMIFNSFNLSKNTLTILLIIYLVLILSVIITHFICVLLPSFRLRTALIFVIKDNKVLMINKKKSINVIGGKCDPSEVIIDCLHRECKEESNLDIINYEYRGLVTYLNKDKNIQSESMYIFVVSEFDGELKSSNEGEVSFVSISDIDYSKMYESDKDLFKAIFNNSFVTGTIKYNKDELLSQRLKIYNKKEL